MPLVWNQTPQTKSLSFVDFFNQHLKQLGILKPAAAAAALT
jgi:hypothetical protein